MSIADRVHHLLEEEHIPYDTLQHTTSHSSVQTAIAAQIPLNSLAKAVILKDDLNDYLMAVIPSSNRLQMRQVQNFLDRPVKLASETDAQKPFSDCQFGAIPPIARAYEMSMIWDDRLSQVPDIYLESGDHETLLHIDQEGFQQLIKGTPHSNLCSQPRHDSRPDPYES
ncbi:YbaK/EbsC family protein [Endozoicomonas gorgoniicola]|uniref:YbaK/EbsC family protein n=1 Tax=Endozoicomonas gorgoniicola TaxID=1234144 RepID=A0ABT3MV83_9GAMM|nr:YbaK/EbsC family protein [Endozoicomonas gorgoniicola]MCW7553264.1 YbaK/EbsC family protein [Endozoicomonas gorgoniicola]